MSNMDEFPSHEEENSVRDNSAGNSFIENDVTELDENWRLRNSDLLRSFNLRSNTEKRSMDVESGYISPAGRRNRTISVTSGITNLAFDHAKENDHVTQLGNNHYMIRRRGTKIFVKAFPGIGEAAQEREKEDIFEENNQACEVENTNHSISWLLSGLYAVVVVIIGLVIKMSQFITEDVTAVAVDWFFITLYGIASVWMVVYQPLVTSCYRDKEKVNFSKSNIANNRWLKGVLALFGLAIIIKDGLEFIAFLNIDSELCTDRTLYAVVPVLHAVFIVSQVNYLFQHSKVFTQEYLALSRFGVMHVVATNLAIWIGTIVDETAGALLVHEEDHGTNETTTTTPHLLLHSSHDLLQANQGNNATELQVSDAPAHQSYTGYRSQKLHEVKSVNPYIIASHSTDVLFSGNCSCESGFCSTVAVAEAFLYPFVIEFSLVACCVLYVAWRNIGKTAPICEHVIKPSYKLYRSYKGTIAGALTLFATVLVIVVLATSHSHTSVADRDYFSEYYMLIIYNSFNIVLETFMIFACLLGFYLFQKIAFESKHENEELDGSLLIICWIGPLVISIFSILAVIQGKENKIYAWGLTMVLPISDMLQSLIQVIFLIDGLRRGPLASVEGQEAATAIQETANAIGATSLYDDDDEIVNDFDIINPRARSSSFSSSVSSRVRYPNAQRPAAIYAASLASLNNPTQQTVSPQAFTNSLHQLLEEPFSSDNESNNELQENQSKITIENDQDLTNRQAESSSFPPQTSETSFSQNDKSEQSQGEDKKTGKPIMAIVKPHRDEDDKNPLASVDMSTIETEEVFPNELPDEERVGQNENQKAYSVSGKDGSSFNLNRGFKKAQSRRFSINTHVSRSGQPTVKIVAETRISNPDKWRLLLRNVLMFLLIANACLWMFYSLEGTAFVVYRYQDIYFGDHIWTTITMLCRPLSIFFRMHSAACLFEIWSFA